MTVNNVKMKRINLLAMNRISRTEIGEAREGQRVDRRGGGGSSAALCPETVIEREKCKERLPLALNSCGFWSISVDFRLLFPPCKIRPPRRRLRR